VERQLRHRSCWAPRPGLGPGGDEPQVPAVGEGDAACLPEQEWGGSDSRQQELYRMAAKGSYEAAVSLAALRLLEPRTSSRARAAGAGAQHQPFAHPLPPLGPGDASSKPALLLPAQDGEDSATRSHGLLEKGALPRHVGGAGEKIVIKTEEQQPQEEGSEMLALPQAPSARLEEEVPLSQELPVPWESHAGLDEQKGAGEALGELCEHGAAQPEFKPVVVPVEARPAPALPFPAEHGHGMGTDQPFALPQGVPLGEDTATEAASAQPSAEERGPCAVGDEPRALPLGWKSVRLKRN
ncbi:ZN777 protein, partial [Alectura lathami]|nr:ZN777 protein [Alectura lathami]